jgi:hypothetical protein
VSKAGTHVYRRRAESRHVSEAHVGAVEVSTVSLHVIYLIFLQLRSKKDRLSNSEWDIIRKAQEFLKKHNIAINACESHQTALDLVLPSMGYGLDKSSVRNNINVFLTNANRCQFHPVGHFLTGQFQGL